MEEKKDEYFSDNRNRFIDYYEELNEYIEHLKEKRENLKQVIVDNLIDNNEYNTETQNVIVKVITGSLTDNNLKNNLINILVKEEKYKNIQIRISRAVIKYLKSNKDIFKIFKLYISEKNEEITPYHQDLIKYLIKCNKTEFLTIVDLKNIVIDRKEDAAILAGCIRDVSKNAKLIVTRKLEEV